MFKKTARVRAGADTTFNATLQKKPLAPTVDGQNDAPLVLSPYTPAFNVEAHAGALVCNGFVYVRQTEAGKRA